MAQFSKMLLGGGAGQVMATCMVVFFLSDFNSISRVSYMLIDESGSLPKVPTS